MSAAAQAEGALLLRRLETELAEGSLELPPFPAVAQKALALARDPEASGRALAELVHQDGGLATAVLRGANSAALGGRVPVVSLHQAVARLGSGRVTELVLAVSLRRGVLDAPRHRSVLEALWRECLATGLYAREIARELRESVETAFLCGLLRRVGRLLALRSLDRHPDSAPLDGEQVRDLVEALDGRFGAAAAEAWELPAPVGATLRGGPEAAELQLLTRFAERLARAALGTEEAPAADVEDPDTRALNLYPETVSALRQRAPALLAQVEGALG